MRAATMGRVQLMKADGQMESHRESFMGMPEQHRETCLRLYKAGHRVIAAKEGSAEDLLRGENLTHILVKERRLNCPNISFVKCAQKLGLEPCDDTKHVIIGLMQLTHSYALGVKFFNGTSWVRDLC